MRKISFGKKIILFFSLFLAATIPLSTYILLSQNFDIRNYAEGNAYTNSSTPSKAEYTFDPESLQNEEVKIKSTFANQGKDPVSRIGFEIVFDNRFLEFNQFNSSTDLRKDATIINEENITTYSWSNLLASCEFYPCENSIFSGRTYELNLMFKQKTSSAAFGESAKVKTTFKNIIATSTDDKTPHEVFATLPTTSPSEAISLASVQIASSGKNQDPVCNFVKIDGPMNSQKIQKGYKINFITKGEDPDGNMNQASATIKKNDNVVKTYKWDFTTTKTAIITSFNQTQGFNFVFNEIGDYLVETTFTDNAGGKIQCSGNSALKVSVVDKNLPPSFKTDPKPLETAASSLDINQQYRYDYKAEDAELDSIQYQVVSKPAWIQFKNTLSLPGRNEGFFNGAAKNETDSGIHALIFSVSDGYAGHITSQIWILRVNKLNNDIPKVLVDAPGQESFSSGQTVEIKWRGSDNDKIKTYAVYYARNPLERNSWVSVAKDLPETTTSYPWKTPTEDKGNFYIVVEATDASKDSLKGYGISKSFSIGVTQENQKDQTQIDDYFPQILNISPADQSTVNTKTPVISAELQASLGATIVEDKVHIYINDEEKTKEANITGKNTRNGNILFNSTKSLNEGIQKIKVEFTDSKDKTVSKSWVFTIKDLLSQAESEAASYKVIEILGVQIPLNTTTIIIAIVALILIISALLVPWLIYFAEEKTYKKDLAIKDDYNYYVGGASPSPESIYSSTTSTSTATEIPTDDQGNYYVPSSGQSYKPTYITEQTTETKGYVPVSEIQANQASQSEPKLYEETPGVYRSQAEENTLPPGIQAQTPAENPTYTTNPTDSDGKIPT